MATPRVVRTAAVVAVLVLALPLLLRPATPAQEVPATPSVDGVVISVGSLQRAIDFYTKVLTFELVSQSEVVDEGARSRIARLRLGREAIDLVEHVAPRGRPLPADARSNDRWFQHIAIIVNDIDQAHLWLKRHGVERTSPEPQRLPDWNPNAGGIWAFYFKDPDGHALEILQFPPDKGAARWQAPNDKVFLGIDHTAIVVGDTDASLRLYRDVLGLQVVGRSENHGPEQERLNAVTGARLRITTLRAADGPGDRAARIPRAAHRPGVAGGCGPDRSRRVANAADRVVTVSPHVTNHERRRDAPFTRRRRRVPGCRDER